jgi:hypothetical protein
VVASDVAEYEDSVFPILTGIDALQAALPAGVQTVVTNPPYGDMPHKLVRRWLGLLEPVSGMLCLLLNARWSESKRGQVLTTRHRAYAGKIKMPERIQWFEGTEKDSGGSSQHNHCWLVWDWNRDATKMPFDFSPGDPRLKRRLRQSAGSPAGWCEDVLGPMPGGTESKTGGGAAAALIRT